MPFNGDATTLALLALLAVLVLAVAGRTLGSRGRTRKRLSEAKAVEAAIIEYFRRSGVKVSAECTVLEPGSRYTVMIESEPMKRFRLSHIIEMTVREHVRKACGVEVDKIFWRFPIKDAGQGGAGDPPAKKKADENSDEYINEGLEHYRHIPKPEVTEVPWESFEQVSSSPTRDNNTQDNR